MSRISEEKLQFATLLNSLMYLFILMKVKHFCPNRLCTLEPTGCFAVKAVVRCLLGLVSEVVTGKTSFLVTVRHLRC